MRVAETFHPSARPRLKNGLLGVEGEPASPIATLSHRAEAETSMQSLLGKPADNRGLRTPRTAEVERIIHAATPSIAIGTDWFGVPDSP
jgi:hypothetical protein